MSTEAPTAARFDIGQIVATPGVLEEFPRHVILDALGRHLSGDWSEMSEEDQEANRAATHNGARIFSAYTYDGRKLWIITDAAEEPWPPGESGRRTLTTFLLPSEY